MNLRAYIQKSAPAEPDGNESADSMAVDEDEYGSGDFEPSAPPGNQVKSGKSKTTKGTGGKAQGKSTRGKKAAVRFSSSVA